MKDFAQHFDIDRKTAWEYVQKLQEAGLLLHNRGRSAAVRYRLADHFLKIADRPGAASGPGANELARSPAAQVAGAGGHRRRVFLGGALAHLAGRRPPGGDHRLPARAGILEVVCQVGRRRLLRLHRQWLQD